MHSCSAVTAHGIPLQQGHANAACLQQKRFILLMLLSCLIELAASGGGIPSIIVPDTFVLEGNSGTTNLVFHFSLSEPSRNTVMVDYATRDITAHAGIDYSPSYGVAIFPPGITNAEVIVSVNGDELNEADEYFWLMLTNSIHATLPKEYAVGIIRNDDPAPTLSITDAALMGSGNETNALFIVNLSIASGQTITVDYQTESGSADGGAGFIPVADTLTFAPGTTRQTLLVPVCPGELVENVATFFVSLSDAMNAALARNRGIATIFQNRPVLANSPVKKVNGFESNPASPVQPATKESVNSAATVFSSTRPADPIARKTTETERSQSKTPNRSATKPLNTAAANNLAGHSDAHLSLGVIAPTNFVHVGQDYILVFTVTNHGSENADNVFLTNCIPASATFLAAQASQGTYSHNQDQVLFDLGTLPATSRAAAAIDFRLSAAGFATNIARLGFTSAQGTSTDSFSSLVILATNDLPMISGIPDQRTSQDTPLPLLGFTVRDTETPAENLLLLADSSDKTLIPDQNLIFGGVGAHRTLTVLPARNQSGNATITVTAIDPNGGETSTAFTVSVTPAPSEILTISRTEGVIEPPGFERIERQGDEAVKMSFYAEAGLNYSVEFSDSLSSGDWKAFTNISASATTTLQEISDETASSPQRFYRLKIPDQQAAGEFTSRSAARINLQFAARPGKAYTIEYCDALGSDTWHALTNLGPVLEASTLMISDPERSQRFYRLRSP